MLKNLSLATAFALTMTIAVVAQDAQPGPLVRMTATEWPPYVGPNLPENGASIAAIRDTFERAGIRFEPEFAAWQRSLTTALENTNFNATGPVYYAKAREKICHFSAAIGQSTLGFVQRKDTPIVWKTLEDLTGVSIGAVSGYVNSPEFDRLAAEQILDVSTVYNDALNLRRVAFGRIDLAVIDGDVMRYLMANEPRLRAYRGLLEMNPRPLNLHDMFICFQKTPEGAALRDMFNAHFDRERADAITAQKVTEITAWAAAKAQESHR